MKFTAPVLILLAYGIVCISAQSAEPTPEPTRSAEPEQEPEPSGSSEPEPEHEPEPTPKMGCPAIPAYDHSKCANMDKPAECSTMMDCQMAGSIGSMCCETECGGMKCMTITAPWPNSSTTLIMSMTLLVAALFLNYLA